MRSSSIFLTTLGLALLSGCVASKIVTAPFKAAGTVVETAVDASTQTESEREEDLGRKVLAERKRERDACLKQAETKAERKECKRAYKDD
ncbi:DUF6726 family protein [Parasphingorhabdus cellanae]|uniref:Lipoprotein n=1 Tax=Parasphingorhabdus cellanae TaxID=2806553 RepID=A0ABX7T0C9_9SPHN|nr:DUF6726 family protein [Parasphingorhabdus cellanae]QTD54998.1 hypothetical protein J4G78_12230 [Parasphingorhabdus cellanae]